MLKIDFDKDKGLHIDADGALDELLTDIIYITATLYNKIFYKNLDVEEFLGCYIDILTLAIMKKAQEEPHEVQTCPCHRSIGKLS